MTWRWKHQLFQGFAVFLGLTVSLGELDAEVAQDKSLVVGEFSVGNLENWQEKRFSGKTNYTFKERDGRKALRAISEASASALFHREPVNLSNTPFINWSWMIEQPLSGLDETQKSGDDYAARVYVVFAVGPFFWQKRSLTYVWSADQPSGQIWPNAFTSKALMLAVNDRSDGAGRWINHKRNVREDIKKYFDLDVSRLEGVAIMTDTDNSGKRAIAWYGDVRFSAN